MSYRIKCGQVEGFERAKYERDVEQFIKDLRELLLQPEQRGFVMSLGVLAEVGGRAYCKASSMMLGCFDGDRLRELYLKTGLSLARHAREIAAEIDREEARQWN